MAVIGDSEFFAQAVTLWSKAEFPCLVTDLDHNHDRLSYIPDTRPAKNMIL